MKPLTPRERQVVHALRAAGGLITREALARALYGAEYLPTDREIIKTYIWRLRQRGYAISNMPGAGYFLAEANRCPTCDQELPA